MVPAPISGVVGANRDAFLGLRSGAPVALSIDRAGVEGRVITPPETDRDQGMEGEYHEDVPGAHGDNCGRPAGMCVLVARPVLTQMPGQ
jgi:hypothetical protein